MSTSHRTDEFPAPLDTGDATRRAFLKMAGFAFAAGCSRGVERHAIPLLVSPEEMTPGRALHYATLCAGCAAGCGVLAKSRDGRPIKLEGNPQHPLNRGGLCAAGQASLLGLYDSHRLDHPLIEGKEASWEAADLALMERLRGVRGAVRFLTGTVHGPTRRASIASFLARFPDGRHVEYESLSRSALLQAHEEAFGRRALPRLRLAKAAVIVSIEEDFLGAGLSPVEHTRDWSLGREVKGAHSLHLQYESRLTLSGSKADRRHRIEPGALRPLLAELAAGEGETGRLLAAAAPGTTVVLCGVNDLDLQRLVLQLNRKLGNYGTTLDLERPSFQARGDDREFALLAQEIADGKVGALLVAGANPLYDHPGALDLAKVPLVVSFAERLDETAAAAHFVCPDHHPYESWDDAEPVAGMVTVAQPLIDPLKGTRAFVESLALWNGTPRSAREIVESTWSDLGMPTGRLRAQAVHDGHTRRNVDLPAASAARVVAPGPPKTHPEGMALLFYAKPALLDGRHSHNPWLQELPDPVTKIVWDNYACLAPATAASLKVQEGGLVEVTTGDGSLTLPAHLQRGQAEGVVAIAVGYGCKGTERFHDLGPSWIEGKATVEKGAVVGVNVGPLRPPGSDRVFGATVRKAKGHRDLACTQLWHSLAMPEEWGGEPRTPIRQTTLDALGEPAEHAAHPDAAIWADDHPYTGHHWAMTVDLSRCTGCSACVVGCQAENNIPVVGRDEVGRQRSMQWMRIDRYIDGSEEDLSVTHQPMLCHHCDNAPCETVCPVLATVHSSEGLNQQVYNRCVGTRYCANNCPYKVRRFNWFDYPREDELAHLVLNPDVVVRMRGVMEKCSFCVQRIQEAKAEAKREGRPLVDGDVQPACAQSCPSSAIVFGDGNDPESRVVRERADPRHYHLLEELGVKPSVGYLALVRNRKGAPNHG